MIFLSFSLSQLTSLATPSVCSPSIVGRTLRVQECTTEYAAVDKIRMYLFYLPRRPVGTNRLSLPRPLLPK